MKKQFLILLTILSLFCFGLAFAESLKALPPFTYTGDDPVLAAVCAETVENGKMFLLEDNSVTVPCPIVLKTETVDDTHMRVYGSFWVFNYAPRSEDMLELISGGERPAIMDLEKKEDTWTVVKVDEADSGDEYIKDIRRFCNGDEELEKAFAEAGDASSTRFKEVHLKFLQDYVKTNNLPVKYWKEYGTDPIPLF